MGTIGGTAGNSEKTIGGLETFLVLYLAKHTHTFSSAVMVQIPCFALFCTPSISSKSCRPMRIKPCASMNNIEHGREDTIVQVFVMLHSATRNPCLQSLPHFAMSGDYSVLAREKKYIRCVCFSALCVFALLFSLATPFEIFQTVRMAPLKIHVLPFICANRYPRFPNFRTEKLDFVVSSFSSIDSFSSSRLVCI